MEFITFSVHCLAQVWLNCIIAEGYSENGLCPNGPPSVNTGSTPYFKMELNKRGEWEVGMHGISYFFCSLCSRNLDKHSHSRKLLTG